MGWIFYKGESAFLLWLLWLEIRLKLKKLDDWPLSICGKRGPLENNAISPHGSFILFKKGGGLLKIISWFVSGKQIIIHLRDSDKSRYFAISESNNCFIIRSPSLFFTQQRSQEGEKRWFHLRMSRILVAAKRQSQTQLDDIAQEQTIISRQLFADHVVGSRPIRKICFEW